MKIKITNLGKKFSSDWIFKGMNASFETGDIIGIIGSNGSGKSTLLKILSSSELPSTGEINYSDQENMISADAIFKQMNYCAPYVDLPEELSVRECYDFHHKFKPISMDFNEFIELVWLKNQSDKRIKYFSSGMKQRLRLSLALLSESSIVFLDEPTSNLDEKGKALFQKLIREQQGNKLIFIGSNSDSLELSQTNRTINIMDYKS